MTYIVAEIETPSLREGLDLINKAKRAGADAVKVQFYKVEDLVGEGSSWEDTYRANEMSSHTLLELYHWAHHVGIDFGVSVFSVAQLDAHIFWHQFDFLKIASPEAMDFALIDKAIKVNDRVMVSVSSSLAVPLRIKLLE